MREMKDSGIEWIGEIPSNWNVYKGKYLLRYMQKPVRLTDEVITCFRDGEVTLRSNRREDGFTMSDKEIGYQGIDIGDLVVHGMDGFAGSIGISDSRGKASPVLNVLDTVHNKKYIMYYLRSMAYSNVFLALATGIRVRSCDLRWNKLAELPYPIPSIEEQKKIADYIDMQLERIDALIADIQTQIETLEQYKKSVITEAVTKGLNPDVEMKDSSIDFIGKIPNHWSVLRIKNIGQYRNGLTYSPQDICDENEGTLVLRSSNIKNGKLSLYDNVYVKRKIPHYLMIKEGDILICSRNGSKELIGKNALLPDMNASFGAFMMIYRCENPEYMYYILNSTIFNYYIGSFFTSTINQLTGSNFGNMKIPFCSDKEEQTKIVNYLNNKCAEIDSLIDDKKEQLEILADYKKSLIYEYVTGKKEVM